MKSRSVDTIVSNEEHVRLKIYDGEIPIEAAAAEIMRIEREQHRHEVKRLRERCQTYLARAEAAEAELATTQTSEPS